MVVVIYITLDLLMKIDVSRHILQKRSLNDYFKSNISGDKILLIFSIRFTKKEIASYLNITNTFHAIILVII